MGISIVSRFPIIETHIFMLQNPHITMEPKPGVIYKSHDKGFLFTTLSLPFGKIKCITGHSFPYYTLHRSEWDYVHVYQSFARELLGALEDGIPVLIGADFNSHYMEELVPELFVPYQTVLCSPSRPNINIFGGRHHDYLLSSKDFVLEYASLMNSYFDHSGCMAQFRCN